MNPPIVWVWALRFHKSWNHKQNFYKSRSHTFSHFPPLLMIVSDIISTKNSVLPNQIHFNLCRLMMHIPGLAAGHKVHLFCGAGHKVHLLCDAGHKVHLLCGAGGRGRVPGAAAWADTTHAAGQGPALVPHPHHAGVSEYIFSPFRGQWVHILTTQGSVITSSHHAGASEYKISPCRGQWVHLLTMQGSVSTSSHHAGVSKYILSPCRGQWK